MKMIKAFKEEIFLKSGGKDKQKFGRNQQFL